MSDLTLARLNVLLGAEHSELDRALKEVADRVQATGKKLTSMGRGLSKNVTAPLLAIGAAGFKVAGDFESSLSKMEGLVGVQRSEIDGWRGDIRGLATEYGSSAAEAADAMFFITSAGLRGADAMSVLEASLKASASGLGEVNTIADLATSALNAYGPEVLSAAQATDVLTAAVRAGKLEPSELAGAMGQVLPIASNMGVRFDEVGAAMAAMSRTGTNSAQAATQLRAIMIGLLKPTADAEGALSEMGLSAAGLRNQIREQGLLATLQTLSTEFEHNEDAQARVFGSVEALAGVMDLMGASAGTTAEIFGDLANSAGVLDEAFGAQQTPMLKLSQMWASLKDLALEIGNKIMPTVTGAIERVTAVVQSLTAGLGNLPGPVVTVGVALAAIAAAAGPVLLVLGKLMTLAPLVAGGLAVLTKAAASATAFLSLAAGVRSVSAAIALFQLALGPVGVALAATAAAVAAGVYVWRRWGDEISAVVRAAVAVVRERLEPVADFLRVMGQKIVGAFRWIGDNAIRPVRDFVRGVGEWLIEKLGPIIRRTAEVMGRLLRVLAPSMAAALDGIVEFVDDTRKEMIRMRTSVEDETGAATEALENFGGTLAELSQADLEVTATGLGRNLISARQELEALKAAQDAAADGSIDQFRAASEAVAQQERNVRQLEASYQAAAAAVRGVGREVEAVAAGSGGGGGSVESPIRKAIEELEASLAEAEGMGAALGDAFDVTAAQASAYETVVQALVAANVELDRSVGSNGETLRDFAGSFLELRGGIQAGIEDERTLSRLRSEGETVTNSVMTAEEQRARTIARLDTLLEATAISEETHARALAQAEEAYRLTTPAGERYAELLRAQDQVLRDIQSPFEVYQAKLATLGEMLTTVNAKTGEALLTQEEYNAAVQLAREEFERATGAAGSMGDMYEELADVLAGAFDRGLSAAIRFTTTSQSRFAQWGAQVASEIARVMARMVALQALATFVNPTSALGKALSLPARATGGPVRGREPVLVGERGPEVFVPSGAGQIVANHNLGGGGGISLDFSNFPRARNPLAAARDDDWQMFLRESMREAITDGFQTGGG